MEGLFHDDRHIELADRGDTSGDHPSLTIGAGLGRSSHIDHDGGRIARFDAIHEVVIHIAGVHLDAIEGLAEAVIGGVLSPGAVGIVLDRPDDVEEGAGS